MDKGRRNELTQLKWTKRLKQLGLKKEDGNMFAFKSHGKSCSCSMCRNQKFKRWRGLLLLVVLFGSSCHTAKSIQKSHTDVEQLDQVHAALSNTNIAKNTNTTITDRETDTPGDTSIVEIDPNEPTLTPGGTQIIPVKDATGKPVLGPTGKPLSKVITPPKTEKEHIESISVNTNTETTQAIKDEAIKTHSVASTVNKHTERSTYGWMWWLLLIPIGVYVFRKKLFS